MKNKKLLIAMLSACFLATTALGIACNNPAGDKGNSSDISTEVGVEVSLNKKDLKISVYDEVKLIATVYGSNSAVVWKSSDASVVTVDAEGNVKAISIGSATITATVDNVTASCQVVVEAATTAPVIKLDAEDVYLNIGGSFTSSVKALWKGAEIEENVTYSWTIADGAAEDVATVQSNGNEVVFSALKAGTTTFRVSADIRGNHISKDVVVTVYGDDLSIVATSSAFRPSVGCYELSLATADINGYVSTEDLQFKVYENGVEVPNASIDWSVENGKIVTIRGSKVTSTKAGTTNFIGTYTKNGITATVTVKVNVVKPVVALQETKAVLEVENLSSLTVQTKLMGTIESVTLHGKEILASVNSQKISFNKANMPTKAKDLGEQTLLVATDKVVYELPVTLYTMIINDKAEMDTLVAVAKANVSTEAGVWDGYFVLGNDIDYNGQFIPMTSHNQLWTALDKAGIDKALRYNPSVCGFRGIFDGMGYNIDGLSIGVDKTAGDTAEAGIFGVLHQNGIVRNVSFTNAIARENSGYIAASGGGLIENVSITYKQIGGVMDVYYPSDATNTKPRIMSSFFSTRQGVSDTATVRNCFVDASNAVIYLDEKANAKCQWSFVQLAGSAAAMENVVVVCPNNMIMETSGATYALADYKTLAEHSYVQSEMANWDSSFWTNINGIPFAVKMAENLDAEAEIAFDAPDVAFVGRTTEIGVIGAYTKVALAEKYTGVTYSNGKLTVAADVALNTTITLVLTSYLNEQVVEKDITVKQLSNVTLNQKEATFVASTDTTLDISAGSQYNGESATVYVGSTVAGKGKIVDGKITVDASLFAGAGYGETTVQVMSEKNGSYNFYDLKVFYVTKILRTVNDFKEISVQGGDKVNDTTITGYYILGNDIDCQGATISANRPTSWQSNTVGFRGTFDGNGKKIYNAGIGECGLFGQVGKGAVIKDVTFDNITYVEKKYQRTSLLGHLVDGATITNVTYNIVSYGAALENSGVPFVEQGLLAARYFNNNVVENLTINAAGCGEIYRLIARGSAGNTYINVKIYADGYQTIGDTGDGFIAITEMPAGIEFISTASGR